MANARHAVGNNQILNLSILITVYMRSIRQRISIIIAKCDFTPGRYIWNYYLCQTATAIERMIADGRQAVGDGDGSQTCAIRERLTADARHAIGLTIIGYFIIGVR